MLSKQIQRTVTTLMLLCCIYGCTYNPLNDNNHMTGSAVGATAGGVAGFTTAAALGVTSKPLLGFAALGGAGVGYYISSLRFDSAGVIQAGGQVYTLGDYVTIELPTDNLFDSNSAELLPQSEAALRSAATVLNRFCCQSVLVSGNSSGFASAKYERKLSEERARVVAAYLWSQGVNQLQKMSTETRKLSYVGYGNYFPIANTIKNNSIRMNSRIQITAYPTKDQLLIDKKKQVFGNMGELDEPHLMPEEPPSNTDIALFSQDMLPENMGAS